MKYILRLSLSILFISAGSRLISMDDQIWKRAIARSLEIKKYSLQPEEADRMYPSIDREDQSPANSIKTKWLPAVQAQRVYLQKAVLEFQKLLQPEVSDDNSLLSELQRSKPRIYQELLENQNLSLWRIFENLEDSIFILECVERQTDVQILFNLHRLAKNFGKQREKYETYLSDWQQELINFDIRRLDDGKNNPSRSELDSSDESEVYFIMPKLCIIL